MCPKKLNTLDVKIFEYTCEVKANITFNAATRIVKALV